MAASIYDLTVPVVTTFLKGLAKILEKAEAHCAAKKIEPDALLQARLYPDMFNFARQVQLACDFAKGMSARLAAHEVPSFEDKEKSFAELQARIEKTVNFIGSLKASAFDGAESRTITMKIGGNDMSFPGAVYQSSFAMPNFYFHLTTAYDILRHNGVELGKRDFMGRA